MYAYLVDFDGDNQKTEKEPLALQILMFCIAVLVETLYTFVQISKKLQKSLKFRFDLRFDKHYKNYRTVSKQVKKDKRIKVKRIPKYIWIHNYCSGGLSSCIGLSTTSFTNIPVLRNHTPASLYSVSQGVVTYLDYELQTEMIKELAEDRWLHANEDSLADFIRVNRKNFRCLEEYKTFITKCMFIKKEWVTDEIKYKCIFEMLENGRQLTTFKGKFNEFKAHFRRNEEEDLKV